jgi:hypothetical protein
LFSIKIIHNFQVEYEADYIGLLLMAAAGYDPRLESKYHEKMENIQCLQGFLVAIHQEGMELSEADYIWLMIFCHLSRVIIFRPNICCR